MPSFYGASGLWCLGTGLCRGLCCDRLGFSCADGGGDVTVMALEGSVSAVGGGHVVLVVDSTSVGDRGHVRMMLVAVVLCGADPHAADVCKLLLCGVAAEWTVGCIHSGVDAGAVGDGDDVRCPAGMVAVGSVVVIDLVVAGDAGLWWCSAGRWVLLQVLQVVVPRWCGLGLGQDVVW